MDVFLSSGFEVQQYANDIVQSSSDVCKNLVELREKIEELDSQIKQQISAHHSKLLSQATSIESLEDVLETLNHHISALQLNAERVSSRNNDLFTKTQLRTMQLERLQETCNLLRCTMRVFYLYSRIEQLNTVTGFKDIPKASLMLEELKEIIDEESSLRELEIVQKEVAAVGKMTREFLAQAGDMLAHGLQTQNQSHVGTALQALHNAKSLSTEVEKLFDHWLAEQKKVIDEFSVMLLPQHKTDSDSCGPGAVAMRHSQSSVAIRANLWTNIEKLSEFVLSVHTRISTLVTVLTKRRDMLSHKLFSEEFSLERVAQFWETFCLTLRDHIVGFKGFLKQALENEYPKLIRQLMDITNRFPTIEDPSKICVTEKMISQLRESFDSLEKAYLSKALSRMFDTVNLAFTDDSPPTSKEIEKIIACLCSELAVASFDPQLTTMVSKNIIQTIQLFSNKSEVSLSTDGEASQVIGAMSTGQKKNVAIVNAVYQFREEFLNMVANGKFDAANEQTVEAVIKSTDGLLSLMTNAIEPLISSISSAVSAIIVTVHQEDFSFPIPSHGDTADLQQCSLYLRELQQFIIRVQADYLSCFNCVDFLFERTTILAQKTCQEFVDHAVLLRPLGEGGKLRLAADFSQIELAVTPLFRKVSDIGPVYHVLKAIRPLFFEPPQAIAQHPSIGVTIPYSVAIHLVISLSPDDLQSPHLTAGWSITRYTEWLNSHPEKDRLQFLKGTLEAYARSVDASGKAEYVYTYPLLCELLKNGLAKITATA